MCSDTVNPVTADAWSRAAARADRAHRYVGLLWTWQSSICRLWPGKDTDRYTDPFTARTAHPVLVIGTRFDPATPYQGALTVSRLLPCARLLTLDGSGHVSLNAGSSCVSGHVSRYLLTTQLPSRGTVCVQGGRCGTVCVQGGRCAVHPAEGCPDPVNEAAAFGAGEASARLPGRGEHGSRSQRGRTAARVLGDVVGSTAGSLVEGRL